MIEIVNGYPCFNCTDVEKAKDNIDPAHPSGKTEIQPDDGRRSVERGDAVSFGGRLKALAETGDLQSETRRESPPAYRAPGSVLDLSV